MKRSQFPSGTRQMLCFFILSSLLTAAIAIPSDNTIDNFKTINAIKPNVNLELQELRSGGLQTATAGFIDIVNARPYSVSSARSATGRLSRGTTSSGYPFLVVRDTQFNIRRIVVRLADGSITTFRRVDDAFFAEVSNDVARTIENTKTGNDAKEIPSRLRKLRQEVTPPQHYQDRELQSSCSTFYEIEVAIGYDSTFCDDYSSQAEAETTIENVVAEASLHYETPGLCTMLTLVDLEGYCDSGSDPYYALFESGTGASGCGNEGMLDAFGDYWESNKSNVHRDTAHLFQGRDFTDGNVAGCAWVGALCNQLFGYGVNSVSWIWDETLMASLFAHELGHNCNANHVPSDASKEYIMEPSVNFASDGFSTVSANSMTQYLSGRSCIAELAAPTPPPVPQPPAPTDSPVRAPSSTPTAVPSNVPTSTPSVSPSKAPSSAPTAAPSATPTGTPSAAPVESPVPEPTDPPAPEPTDPPIPEPTEPPVPETTEPPAESPTEPPVAATSPPIPSEPPVPSPTPPPIQLEPTPAPPASCFSGENSVEVEGKGKILIKDLTVGDRVRTKTGSYTRVYSLAHKDDETELVYWQVQATNDKSSSVLEVSDDHYVLANGKYVAGSDLKVGDELAGYDGQTQVIHSITQITRQGLYAPFTESGEMMVSGVAVSNYIRFLDSSVIDQHSMAHWSITPLRSLCRAKPTFCANETHTGGISNLILPGARFTWAIQKTHHWFHLLTAVIVVPMAWVVSLLERLSVTTAAWIM